MAPPVIDSLTPNTGPQAGGTYVTVWGQNLTGVTSVDMGGVPASQWTEDPLNPGRLLTFVTPAWYAVGVSAVAITNADGRTLSPFNFTYYGSASGPTIGSVTPNNGPTAGGTTVTIVGTGFDATTTVSFGNNVPATDVVLVNDTQLTCTSPAQPAGPTSVNVRTGNSSSSKQNAYTYVDVLAVAAVSPSSGPLAGRTTVTVFGSLFDASAAVSFGGVPATNVVFESATRLTCQTPANVPGTVDVVVTGAAGTATLTAAFTYVAPPPPGPPTITSLSPAFGDMAGGTVVAIAGTGFGPLTTVDFGGLAATVQVVSATQLNATTPPWNANPGWVDVTITAAGGTAAQAQAYRYAAPPQPATPPSGTCGRAAWLELGSQSLPLEDDSAGYWCSSLDLGYPEVRSVVAKRPDVDGVIDRTRLKGARAVSAEIVTVAGAAQYIDDVAMSFAPYMDPAARPVLHYVLDRPGWPERTLTLRASGYQWAVAGPRQRTILLQWQASDPLTYGARVQRAIAFAGSTNRALRFYDLTFPRDYVTATGRGRTTAWVNSDGQVAFRPVIRIFGPITGACASFRNYQNPAVLVSQQSIYLVPGYVVQPGHYLEIDCNARTVLLDGDEGQSAIGAIDWTLTSWPLIPAGPDYYSLGNIYPQAFTFTDANTCMVVSWQDVYLS